MLRNLIVTINIKLSQWFLRNLIAALLKREPKDRPGLDSILRRGYIQARLPGSSATNLPESVALAGERAPSKRSADGL